MFLDLENKELLFKLDVRDFSDLRSTIPLKRDLVCFMKSGKFSIGPYLKL